MLFRSQLKPAMLLTRGICYYFHLMIAGVLTVIAHCKLIKRKKLHLLKKKKRGEL